MLGLVADYGSDDESDVVQQQSPQTTQSKEDNPLDSKRTTTVQPFPPSTTTESKKRKRKSGKRKRTAKEIATALGLDKDMEEILSRNDEDDESLLFNKKKNSRVETSQPESKIAKEPQEDEYGFSTTTDDIQHDQANIVDQECEESLLEADFFDTLHEYKPSSRVVVAPRRVVDITEQLDDYGDEQQQQVIIDLPSNLPKEVIRDLQNSGGPSLVDVTSTNRTTMYLGEAQERKILIDKHRQDIYTEDQEAIARRRLALNQTQRSRNQLAYLAHTSQTDELENAERIAKGRTIKQQSYRRYGW